VHCVCGSGSDRGPMLQCGRCGRWAHAPCVTPPGAAPPAEYACTACAAAAADPVWADAGEDAGGFAAPPPARLRPAGAPSHYPPGAAPGDGPVAADVRFTLPPGAAAALKSGGKDLAVHVGCVLLGDPIPSRYHWPRHVDVRVNNLAYRAVSRQPGARLGDAARDAPADVGALLRPGLNAVHVAAFEAPGRPFAVVVRCVRRRTQGELEGLMAPAETLAAAVARVKAAVRGSAGGDGDGSDDAPMVTSAVVSLRCPLTGARVAAPARVACRGGLPAFDATAFIALASRTRKWVCPHTLAPAPLGGVTRDAYLTAVVAALAAEPGVAEVEVGPDARWRPAEGGPWRDVVEGGGVGVVAVAVVKAEAGVAAAAPPPAPPAPSPPAAAVRDDGAEVICLSSSDDEGAPEASRRAPAPAPPARAAATPPSRGLSIRLPPRPAPADHRTAWTAEQRAAAAAAEAAARRSLAADPATASRLAQALAGSPAPTGSRADNLAALAEAAGGGRGGRGGGG